MPPVLLPSLARKRHEEPARCELITTQQPDMRLEDNDSKANEANFMGTRKGVRGADQTKDSTAPGPYPLWGMDPDRSRNEFKNLEKFCGR